MYTIKFTLKQHTPIIHFQHYQDGATLRATEVKPKLDKFIIEREKLTMIKEIKGKNVEVPKPEYEAWFIGKDTLSLNYKLFFFCSDGDKNDLRLTISGPIFRNEKNVYETSAFPNFLANMGGKERKEELKNFSFHKKITGQITTYFEKLEKIIAHHLHAFFYLQNFGNRKSKGFGSFTVLNPKPQEGIIEFFKSENKNYWYWNIDEEKDTTDVFTDIAIIYSLLKTGINFPDHPRVGVVDERGNPIMQNGRPRMKLDDTVRGPYNIYFKSYLYQYFNTTTNYGNEKRFIKENFFTRANRITNDGTTKKYVRAILGTAPFNEYRDRKRKGIIEFKSDEADRYQSPIIFKIIDKYVIFFIDESVNGLILNKEFEFSETYNNITNRQTINTPEDFNLIKFINAFIDYFHSLINDIDAHLFDQYEQGDKYMPIPVSNVIDVISKIEILKPNN